MTRVTLVRVEGCVAYISLTQGLEAMIDVEDVPLIEPYLWFAHNNGAGYCARSKQAPVEHMHRLLMGDPSGLVVDHINGNRLDNRRANLRAVYQRDNVCNRRPNQNLDRKGVWQDRRAGRWNARIKVDGRRIHLGSYATRDEALTAYDAGARLYHGSAGRPNDPPRAGRPPTPGAWGLLGAAAQAEYESIEGA